MRLVEFVTGLLGLHSGFGRLDVAFQLDFHFFPGELLQHLQLGLGHVQRIRGLVDGEMVGLQLLLRDVTSGGQLLAVIDVFLCLAQVLLGHELFIEDGSLRLLVLSFQILLFCDQRRLVNFLGLDQRRLAVAEDDRLVGSVDFQGR